MTHPHTEFRRWFVRLFRPDLWTTEALTIASVLGGALTFAHFSMALSTAPPDVIDFDVFYDAVRRWMAGGPLYGLSHSAANYNPPHLHLIMLPLAVLPRTVAFVAWTAISIVCAVMISHIAMRETPRKWGMKNVRLLSAAMLLSAGTVAAIHVGQVSWIVALLLTYAWRDARHQRWLRAGAWLGMAAGVKPFLLFFVPILIVRRRWACVAAALILSAGSVVSGAAIFGVAAIRQWLGLLSVTPPKIQLAFFINASISALLARASAPHAIWILAVATVAAVSVGVAFTADEDRVWLIAIAGSLLVSPLGWVYYLPLLTAPLIVLAAEQRLPGATWTIWPLLVVPPVGQAFLQSNALEALSVGSVYSWGLLLLWIFTIFSAVRPGTSQSGPTAAHRKILPGNKILSR